MLLDGWRAVRRRRNSAMNGLAETDDDELIEATRNGDVDAFGELYHRHRPAARAAAAALRIPRSEREDVVEEAFANIFATLQRGRGPRESFRPYLIAAVRNITFSRARREVRAVEGTRRLMTEIETAEQAHELSVDDLVTAAFKQLPERWRHILVAVEIEGRKPGELGAELVLSPNAASALVARARRGLRSAYLDELRRDNRPRPQAGTRPTLSQAS
jgi:RNA polymerase sigma factor (sigma-70 family)